jgi:protein TonB
MVALGVAALLHVFFGYALVTGLALKAVKVIVEPLETTNVEEQKPPEEEPPPPPPKMEEIPPYVPPPDVVVESVAPPPPITIQTTVPTV